MTADDLRRALAHPDARDPAHHQALVIRRPDGTPARPAAPPPGASPREAAVLVALTLRDGEIEVLLTVRSDEPPSHPGQISFPGGSRASCDATLRDTALREAREEVGLDPALVELAGELGTIYIPPTNFLVAPFVGVVRGEPRYVPDPREVTRILELPLGAIADPDAVEEESRLLRGEPYVVPFYRFGEHKIWGATACILAALGAAMGSLTRSR